MVLGILAAVSFSQFLALLFKDPKIGLGIFILIVFYFSFFTFYHNFYVGLLLPNMFFCFAMTKNVTTSTEVKEVAPHHQFKLSLGLQVVILISQTFFYFTLSVILDKMRRGKLISPKASLSGSES